MGVKCPIVNVSIKLSAKTVKNRQKSPTEIVLIKL